jgi:hypothetical protein
MALGLVCALIALRFFYKGADEAEQARPDQARRKIMMGVSALTAPLVMYLCYSSLGI